MKVYIYCILIIMIALIVGCDKKVTFEESFHKQMENQMELRESDINYTLIHHKINVVQEDDAIAVFIEHREEEDVVFIAYFKKEGSEWKWKQTTGNTWNGPINWTSMNNTPYIYAGAISDDSIFEVFVNKTKAYIIDVNENKQFWYAIDDKADGVVKYVFNDGTEEVIEKTK